MRMLFMRVCLLVVFLGTVACNSDPVQKPPEDKPDATFKPSVPEGPPKLPKGPPKDTSPPDKKST